MLHLNKTNRQVAHWVSHRRRQQTGFTLIEMMIVVVILAIIAAIALPSYLAYTRKAEQSQAQQEMQKIAEQLGRHKARNFSYKKFDPAYMYGQAGPMTSITVKDYTITIVDLPSEQPLTTTGDTVRGRDWAIKAETSDSQKYNLLMTSTGLRCKSKASISGYTGCPGDETW